MDMSSRRVQVQEEEEEDGLLRAPLEQNMFSTEQDRHIYPGSEAADKCACPLFSSRPVFPLLFQQVGRTPRRQPPYFDNHLADLYPLPAF